ncbi:hypothetical protein SNE40_005907 [Patella caerulea]|uniref:Mutator-like transposase domain-containing protein n=1 Tax=Patella caerulea TaxID=87958 RepID=A0AAN8JVW2_PATCE
MREKIETVKFSNEKGGAVNPNIINVAVDGRYNSITIGQTKKPGQAASQAIGIACQTNTKHKYILSAVMQHKLCWLRGKGVTVNCPGGHEGCTASLPVHAPLFEYDMGKSIGTELALQNVHIKYAKTDGDGRSAAGIEDSLKILHPMWSVERLADPSHLAATQLRHCYNEKFTD